MFTCVYPYINVCNPLVNDSSSHPHPSTAIPHLVRAVGRVQGGARSYQGLRHVQVPFHQREVQGRVLVHVREGEVGLFVVVVVVVVVVVWRR